MNIYYTMAFKRGFGSPLEFSIVVLSVIVFVSWFSINADHTLGTATMCASVFQARVPSTWCTDTVKPTFQSGIDEKIWSTGIANMQKIDNKQAGDCGLAPISWSKNHSEWKSTQDSDVQTFIDQRSTLPGFRHLVVVRIKDNGHANVVGEDFGQMVDPASSADTKNLGYRFSKNGGLNGALYQSTMPQHTCADIVEHGTDPGVTPTDAGGSAKTPENDDYDVMFQSVDSAGTKSESIATCKKLGLPDKLCDDPFSSGHKTMILVVTLLTLVVFLAMIFFEPPDMTKTQIISHFFAIGVIWAWLLVLLILTRAASDRPSSPHSAGDSDTMVYTKYELDSRQSMIWYTLLVQLIVMFVLVVLQVYAYYAKGKNSLRLDWGTAEVGLARLRDEEAGTSLRQVVPVQM